VADSTTVRAIAYKSGMTISQLRVGQYVINAPGPTNTKFTVVDANITESSHQGSGNTKSKTVDGDLATGWQSAAALGEWLRYDLGSNQRVGFVKMAFPSANIRSYRFVIQGSTDGTNFTNILPANFGQPGVLPHRSWTGTDALSLQEYNFPDVDGVRYIRIVGYGYTTTPNLNVINATSAWREVEIWGGAVGSGNPFGIYQAENAAMVGANVKTNVAGYTGTGFVDYINASGDYVEWTITNPVAGIRGLTWRYGSTSPRTLSVAINGVVVNASFTFPSTTNNAAWMEKAMTTTLPAGTVTIRLTATGTSGPNVDSLKIN
jgi:hypothetical protein